MLASNVCKQLLSDGPDLRELWAPIKVMIDYLCLV